MFDPKSAEAFKSIQAPNTLKERVFNAKPKRRAYPYTAFGTAVAAGLVAVFLAVQFFVGAPVGVLVGSVAVGDQAALLDTDTMPMMARMGASTSQTVCFDEDVTILSADGMLTDEDYTALTLPYEAKAGTTLWWHAQTPPTTFFLTAKAKGETIQLCLTYEEAEQQWTICRVAAE